MTRTKDGVLTLHPEAGARRAAAHCRVVVLKAARQRAAADLWKG